MRIKFLVTPMALMMGNVVSARRLMSVLRKDGIDVTDEPEAADYDLLHVHTPIPFKNIKEVVRARKSGIPVVMHAHTTAEDAQGTWTGSTTFSPIVGKYLTKFYNKGDLVIVPSEWTKSKLRKRGVRVPITVLSNGIDLEKFQYSDVRRERFRKKYDIPENAKVVYLIGVICLKKGIKTLPAVSKALPDLSFVWIGKTHKMYSPFDVNRAVSQCPGNVRFLTDVDDIVDAHAGGDIFMTPSFAENQGIAVLEALAMGRPVVARNLDVYWGLLKDGRNALVCSNEKEFVAALKKLNDDEKFAAKLVSEGKKSVAVHEISRIARELVKIYNSLLDSHKKTETPAGA